ncbi:MAG: sulfatase [Planctomycetota bacterium]
MRSPVDISPLPRAGRARAARWALSLAGLLSALTSCGGSEPEVSSPPLIQREVRLDLLHDEFELRMRFEGRETPAQLGSVRPASTWQAGFAARRALVTPPGATVSFPVVAERDTALSYAVAVDAAAQKAGAAGMQFRILVDANEVARHDCRAGPVPDRLAWIEGEVDLGAHAGKTVRLTLAAEPLPGGARTGFAGGWSPLRLVKKSPIPRRRRDADHPSVLVFLVDTLRADAISAYRNPRKTTPNLDALAAEGLVFERAIAPAPWTLPSVASLFTGLGPYAHGAINPNRTRLVEEHDTLAEKLLRSGTSTGAFVRNPLITRIRNFDQGFEVFRELSGGQPADTYAAFLEWMRERKGDQCFGYLHVMAPHAPYAPPAGPRERFTSADYTGPYPDASQEVLWKVREALQAREDRARDGEVVSDDDVRHFHDLYEAEVAAWDERFGALLDTLRAEGLLDDTVIVVTSDHGEEFFEHGLLSHGQTVHEELVHVPLLLHGPGVPASRVAAAVPWIELNRTLLELAGLQPGEGGRTLLDMARGAGLDAPILLGSDSGQRRGVAGMERVVGLRTETQKLVWWPRDDRFELYDLTDDPGEANNLLAGKDVASLASDAPEARLIQELRQRVDAELRTQPQNFRPADEATMEALRALGYAK